MGGKSLAVTKTLCQALLRFRQPKEFTRIWIDQICIDQFSVAERNQQINIMRDIYSRAKIVRIWLGEAERGGKEAMRFIPKLLQEPQKLPEGYQLPGVAANLLDLLERSDPD